MIRSLALGVSLATMFSGGALAEDAVDFSKYMQSPQALTAIASAVSTARGCSVPLTFEETKEDGDLVLSVNCFGNEDDELTVVIRFMDDGYSLLPIKFDYAG